MEGIQLWFIFPKSWLAVAQLIYPGNVPEMMPFIYIHRFTVLLPTSPAEFSVFQQSWGILPGLHFSVRGPGSQVKRFGGKRISRLCSSLELIYWAVHGLCDLLRRPKLTGAGRNSRRTLKHIEVNDEGNSGNRKSCSVIVQNVWCKDKRGSPSEGQWFG